MEPVCQSQKIPSSPENSRKVSIYCFGMIVKRTNRSISLVIPPLEEVQSLELRGLTISHNISWFDHIARLASKAKSTDLASSINPNVSLEKKKSELLKVYKAFIRSSMKYCSPLWAGVPACLSWILWNLKFSKLLQSPRSVALTS